MRERDSNGRYKRLTNEEFETKVHLQLPYVKILDKYQNNKQKIKYLCMKCGYKGEAKAIHLLEGHGCPVCNKVKKKTHADFLNEISNKFNYIEILSEYKNNKSQIEYRCLKCGHIHTARADHLLSGHGCPYCRISMGEKKISEILDKYNIHYEQQKGYNGLIGLGGGNLLYDFYLPDYNLLIEYQGIQHKEPVKFFGGDKALKSQQKRDEIKREYALNHNINLLEIWYNENIEQKLKETLNLETLETAGV